MEVITLPAANSTILYELPLSNDGILSSTRDGLRLFCGLAIFLELLMIETISEYKNMRKPDNLYVKCLLICHVLFLILGIFNKPLVEMAQEYVYILELVPTIFRVMAMGFAILIMFYWAYGWRQLPIFKIHYRKLMYGVFLFGLGNLLVIIYSCLWPSNDNKDIYSRIYIWTEYFALGMTFSLVVWRRGYKSLFAKTNPMSTAISTSFVFLGISLELGTLLLSKYIDSHRDSVIWTIIFAQILDYSYSIILLILFCILEFKFRIGLRIICKCKVTKEELDVCHEDLSEDLGGEDDSKKLIKSDALNTKIFIIHC